VDPQPRCLLHRYPVIPNIPGSIPADQASFFVSVKSAIDALTGQGRGTDRAVRMSEVGGIIETAQSPSTGMPDAPTGLTITKGIFSHTLTWTNPSDENVSHIEIWVAVNSQSIADASLIGIVTVTPDLIEEEGEYINSGFDVTADMTYWIRSLSYGDVYSEWHPTLVTGGLAVAGDESVSEAIDGVINLLKGEDPDLYSDDTVYSLYARCQTSDGRVWESISIDDHSGNEPPNATYWKRAGILMTGDVDGVPTAAIDGNLVVDDTILARHIQAGSIVASHMEANQVLVGHTIESANFETGVSGWQIDGVGGTAEFNNIALTISYSSVTGGPPSDADKTQTATAYDTSHVNGTAASTVRDNAAAGATFTDSDAGSLAWLSSLAGLDISNSKAYGKTLISGGYIHTDILRVGTAQIQNAAITNAKIGNAEVDTLKIAGNSVTLRVAASGSNPTLYITTSGGDVLVMWSAKTNFSGLIPMSQDLPEVPGVELEIDGVRQGSTQTRGQWNSYAHGNRWAYQCYLTLTGMYLHCNVSAGSHSYKLHQSNSSYFDGITITAIETKR
jgi:hypothetical protein